MSYGRAKMDPRAARVAMALGFCRRIVIVGGPKAGKSTLGTTLAEALGVPLRSTDSIERPWSEKSDVAAEWLREPGPQVVEGVAAVRALRKLLRDGGDPGAIVVRVRGAHPAAGPLSPGQESMAKGVDTIWREVAPELARRGVLVVEV